MRDLNPHEMKPSRVQGASKSMNANNKSASSMDYQDISYRVKTSAGFDTLASDADTLRLEDIERIKLDLNQEKNKIRLHEDQLNKLINRFKIKEEEIDYGKKLIDKRKDDLTNQERSLLEDRKRFSERMEKFKEEKRNYDIQRDKIESEINEVNQNIIVAKSKNSILQKKIDEYMKKKMELNNRREYLLMYSAASNTPPTDHLAHKRANSEFLEGTFQGNNAQERNRPSVYNENMGYRDDMIHQINNEREKIDHMQRDLENIKHIEEQLMQELIEKEKRRATKPRSNNPFSTESGKSSANNTLNNDNLHYYLKKPDPNQQNLIIHYESRNPNNSSRDYMANQRQYIQPQKDMYGTMSSQQDHANMSLSSSYSSYAEGRDSYKARQKKTRNNAANNMNNLMNKFDEKNV